MLNKKIIDTGERSAKIICNNPYPCDFDLGIIEAMCRRFKPEDCISVDVKHDSGDCRKNGDETCQDIGGGYYSEEVA